MTFKHANLMSEGAAVRLDSSGEGVKTAGDGNFTLKEYVDEGKNAVVESATGSTFTVPSEDVIPIAEA